MAESSSSSSDSGEFEDEFPFSDETEPREIDDHNNNTNNNTRIITPPTESNEACSYPFFFGLLLMATVILVIVLSATVPGENHKPTSSSNTVSASHRPPNGGTTVSSTGLPMTSEPSDDSPTSTPRPLTPAEMTTDQYLQSKAIIWSGSDVIEVGTAAHSAFDWLITLDPKHLGKDSSDRDIRQRYIAAVIYFATQGQYWQARGRHRNLQNMKMLYGFLSGDDVCDWNFEETGIFCNEDGNIEIIRFLDVSMKGTFPKEIGYLTDLVLLDMSKNEIAGTLPTELGLLSNIDRITLHSNKLSGSIPTQLGGLTNLKNLNLNKNFLKGSIPSQIGNLFRLELLDVTDNELTQTLPTRIGGLIALTSLQISQNTLQGALPTELGMLLNLNEFQLYSNEFSDSIPTEVGLLTSLTNLYLNNNKFTGKIPTEFGFMVSLKELHMKGNQFTGTIPSEFGLIPLEDLDLSKNKLQGQIPSEIATISSLFAINLAENYFTGEIPADFAQCTLLNNVYLQRNEFSGSLDNIFCLQEQPLPLQNLEADCKGSSTPEIQCTCCTLCCDTDGENCISSTSTSVTATSTLSPQLGKERFDQLVGILQPISGSSSFGDSSSAQYKAAWWLAAIDGIQMDFSSVRSDKIIQRYVLALLWYGLGGENWKNRKNYASDLVTCSWDGVSCDTNGIVIEIDLGDNNLVGRLPSEIGFFPNLQSLVLERNEIGGKIPSSLFQMTQLTMLSLSDNVLTGEIPTQLGQLGLCEVLDLCKSYLLPCNNCCLLFSMSISQILWISKKIILPAQYQLKLMK